MHGTLLHYEDAIFSVYFGPDSSILYIDSFWTFVVYVLPLNLLNVTFFMFICLFLYCVIYLVRTLTVKSLMKLRTEDIEGYLQCTKEM